jgi:drug/metabolite transporter (DMT)-like permease
MSDRGRGYGMVAASYLILGSIGALVAWAQAPESVLVVLRMGIAAVALGAVFARRALWAELRRPGVSKLLMLAGALDAANLLLFFTSMRLTSVAVGMFLMFLAPLWVALLAPLVLGLRTDRVVWPALGIALGGLAFIVVPPALGEELALSPLGIACGLGAGVTLAGFTMTVSGLRARGLRSASFVTAESALVALLVLPVAIAQMWGGGVALTRVDLFSGLILGLVCTVVAYTLWAEGVGFIPVQHVPILGYLQPLAAPVYAFLLVGEVPSIWTVLGGLLVVAAGALVIVKGRSLPAAVPIAAEASAAPGR